MGDAIISSKNGEAFSLDGYDGPARTFLAWIFAGHLNDFTPLDELCSRRWSRERGCALTWRESAVVVCFDGDPMLG